MPEVTSLPTPASDTTSVSAPNLVSPAATTETAPPDISTLPDTGINPMIPPTPPKGGTPVGTPNPPRHEVLLNMIQGLSIGLGAAAHSMATGGREGGVQEVTQIQGELARQKQAAEAAATAQTNAKLQQQLTQGEINKTNYQNISLGATLQDEVAKSHMGVEAEKQGIAGGAIELQNKAQEQFDTRGQVPAGWTVNPSTGQVTQIQSGAPAAQTPGAVPESSVFARHQNMILDASAQELQDSKTGKDDPLVTSARQVMANPNASIFDKKQAVLSVQQKAGIAADTIKKLKDKAELTTAQESAAANAPLGTKANDLNKMTEDRFHVLNPGKPLPAEYKVTPESTPKDVDRIHANMKSTEDAQGTAEQRKQTADFRQQQLDLQKGVDIPGDSTKTGPEYLASLKAENPAMAATVKQIIEGRGAPPPAGSRSPAAQKLLGAVNLADDKYDSSRYPAYLQAREKFTAGKEGAAVNALNTVEHHLARMYDHANSAFTSGGVTGRITGFFGDKDVIALGDDAKALASELAKAYAGGQISEGEKNDWQRQLDIGAPGMTTGKLITNLKEIDGLLEGKQSANQDQWNSAAPSPSIASSLSMISSQAAADRAHLRGEASQAGGHEIEINGVHYTYSGSGDTADLKNYKKK